MNKYIEEVSFYLKKRFPMLFAREMVEARLDNRVAINNFYKKRFKK
jgi:CRISPR/Cas system-associated endonuclease Cas1